MNQDVDALYPSLSALAKIHNKDLNGLAKSSSMSHHTYIGLADCCSYVFNDRHRWANADCANYLATLNEYVRQLGPLQAEHVWGQLIKGAESTFLDTLGEATWYLHFKNEGHSVAVHVPFDDTNLSSGDADLVVTVGTKQWWLDVYSIGATRPNLPRKDQSPYPFSGRTLDSIVTEIGKRAIKKYHSKFKKAVRAGHLKGRLLGLLICILKREPTFLLPLTDGRRDGHEVSPPSNLFRQDQTGLDMVYVHTLRARVGSELLRPLVLCKWQRE
jgi:hypothetical protein